MSGIVVISSLPHQTTQEEIAERFRGFKGFLNIRIYYNEKQESLTAEVEFTSFELAEFAKKTVQLYNTQLRMHVEFRENFAQPPYPEYQYQTNQQQPPMAYQQPVGPGTLPPSLGVSSQYPPNDAYPPNPPYGQHLSQNPSQQQYSNINSFQGLNPSSLPPPPPPPSAQIYQQNQFQEQQQQIRHMPYPVSSSQQPQFQQPINPPPPPMLPPQQIQIDTYPTNSSSQQYSHPNNVQPIRPASNSSGNYHSQSQSNNSNNSRQFQTPQTPQTRVSQNNNSNSNIQQQQKQPQYTQPLTSSSYPEKQHRAYPDTIEDNLGQVLLSEIKATSSQQMKTFRNSEGQTNSLYLDGIPIDSTEREVSHIFRPYPGFIGVRLIRKKTQAGREFYFCFVDFVDAIQASIAHKTLQGYRFDKNDTVGLKISFANESNQAKKSDYQKSQIYNSFSNTHPDDYDQEYEQGRNSSQASRNSFGSSHHHKNEDHRYDDFRDKQRGYSRRN